MASLKCIASQLYAPLTSRVPWVTFHVRIPHVTLEGNWSCVLSRLLAVVLKHQVVPNLGSVTCHAGLSSNEARSALVCGKGRDVSLSSRPCVCYRRCLIGGQIFACYPVSSICWSLVDACTWAAVKRENLSGCLPPFPLKLGRSRTRVRRSGVIHETC